MTGYYLDLIYTSAYSARGLGEEAQCRLAVLGDLLRRADSNVTGIKEPEEIERLHFLDTLSLLEVPEIISAKKLADIGSGAGLPALVLALALPGLEVTAVESQRKKCAHIQKAAVTLGLENITVCCHRVEEYGHSAGRELYDVVVSRALAALPTVAEYSLPLLRVGGLMVAMKGAISDQERTQAFNALAILGADELYAIQLHPFAEAQNRWVCVAKKNRATPGRFPRRPGIPVKRPLGR